MIAQQYQLYIERRDPRRSMARFYALSIEETLFGQARPVRRWGRSGTIGRTVQHSFDDEGDAVQIIPRAGARQAEPRLSAESAPLHAEAAPSR